MTATSLSSECELALKDIETAAAAVLSADAEDQFVAVTQTIETAIRHGVDIFNQVSQAECALVYLDAAKRILRGLQEVEDDGSIVVSGTVLARRLFLQIVQGLGEELTDDEDARCVNPVTDLESGPAHDLAWQLRYAFDAILRSPLRNQGLMLIDRLFAAARGNTLDAELLQAVVTAAIMYGNKLFAIQEFYCIATMHCEVARLLVAHADRSGVVSEYQDRVAALSPLVDRYSDVTVASAEEAAWRLYEALQPMIGAVPPRGFDVFISYRREHFPTAELLRLKLSDQNLEVFLDNTAISPGSKFDELIDDAVAGAPVLLLILSRKCLHKCDRPDDWVRREIEQARKSNSTIIPVQMPDFKFPKKLPKSIAFLRETHMIDFAPGYFDPMVEKLTNTVHRVLRDRSS